MKQVFSTEAIGLTPEEERAHRRTGTLRQANRAARPRVEELTGLMLSGAFQRRRLRPKADYQHANRHGTRGVRFFWTLECGPIYQTRYRTDWKTWWCERIITVAPDGTITDLSEEQARACLENVTSA